MVRIVRMSGKYYGVQINNIEDDLENIIVFIDEGTPVILVNDIEDLSYSYGIDAGDVTMVEVEDSIV